ncbi:inositol monophosphatase family protein [Algiphilus aromaticivorans]|jgi:histidinol-phosphatase|uniref:inositol monophosphatase family protein n=1 Tax=Algiphilus aromaticivorans TaxID=382454 RepID=UPI0005C166D4|nr:inositol monophosphatase family protein [Algiphilus aromaticivorans]
MQQFLDAALGAATAAAGVIRDGYAGGFKVRTKADASPVTEVDEAAEKTIKAHLAALFPDHGFYGEEFGIDRPDADYVWLVDPIDGTKAFVRGYPMFSTQIALMHRGELIVGVSCAPCFGAGETFFAARGMGAWRCEGVDAKAAAASRVQVSRAENYAETSLSMGNIATLAGQPRFARFAASVIPQLQRIRGYGDFLHYHLLASAKIDAVLESDINILDIAALAVIVREAGGVFTELDGGQLTLETGDALAAATPELYRRLQRELV